MEMIGSPLAWSPDSRYLTFVSYENEERFLYIWDGNTVTNISPVDGLDTVVQYYVDRGIDGRLAFVAVYGWSIWQFPPEIYIWDWHIDHESKPKSRRLGFRNPLESRWSTNCSVLNAMMAIAPISGTACPFRNEAPDVDTFIRDCT